jgi:putative ABC transport system permease protein
MIVIALFGIVNTQALHIVERVRELGLVRAIGMDRRQVRAMVRWEAVIVATIGTVTGLSAGAFLGWALTRALRLPVTLPVSTWALVAAGAVLVVGASATFPARRAGRVETW